MKRETLVALSLWLGYALGWYCLLQMGGEQYTSVLVLLAVVPSFPMSEWFWGPTDCKYSPLSFWGNVLYWIRLWSFGTFWVAVMGFLMGMPLQQFGLFAYIVPVVWLVFILIHLYVQWEMETEMTRYKTA